MGLTAGDKLGPYEIISLIGKGGMGEVYSARDQRLNRDVAIKISTAQFSEHFEREARLIASLNHPNICTLHDVGFHRHPSSVRCRTSPPTRPAPRLGA